MQGFGRKGRLFLLTFLQKLLWPETAKEEGEHRGYKACGEASTGTGGGGVSRGGSWDIVRLGVAAGDLVGRGLGAVGRGRGAGASISPAHKTNKLSLRRSARGEGPTQPGTPSALQA